MTEKKIFDLRFLFPDVKVTELQPNLKQSRKNHVLKNYLGELHSGVLRYFPECPFRVELIPTCSSEYRSCQEPINPSPKTFT